MDARRNWLVGPTWALQAVGFAPGTDALADLTARAEDVIADRQAEQDCQAVDTASTEEVAP